MLPKQLRHLPRAGAAALDHVANAATAQVLEHRVDGEASSSSRQLGHPLTWIALCVGGYQVGSAHTHGGTMRLRMGAHDQPAIVRNIQPFMRVGGPGVGEIGAGGEMFEVVAHGSPESKCAIHVKPRAGFAGSGGDFRQWIESSGVNVAGLSTDDGGASAAFDGPGQLGSNHPSLLVGGNVLDRARAQAQHAQCSVHG
jgi:hypothetical protein